ncbi:MAG: hypothetical protein ACKV2O_10785 [Acidimicrobiales bacterium]
MVSMLTHLHHTPRVGPAQHRWARDAVRAAQLGAAALVVVTAVEWRSERGDAQPGQPDTRTPTELVRTEDAASVPNAGLAVASAGATAAAAPPTTAPVGETAAPQAPVTDVPVVATPAAEAPAPEAPAAEAPAAEEAAAAPAPMAGPPSVHIEVQSAETSGTAISAADVALESSFGTTVQVQVRDASSVVVATAMLNPGDVARIADLPAGDYHLTLHQTSGVSEPSPGVAISAAIWQRAGSVQVAAGEVLLISLQHHPVGA